MGCVLGKRVSGESRDPSGAAKEPSSTAVNGGHKVPKKEDKWSAKIGCNGRFPRLQERRRDSIPVNLLSAPVNPGGWPAWLSAVAGDALLGWTPRRADSFQKLEKIGQGTYSNVYKARDLETRKIVALKKVRFDSLEPESVKFMAREITLLRRLDHPNVVRLEGLVISRVSCSLYLIFEYMEHDLAGLVASPSIEFSEPQVKCYMKQLLSGLEHCHSRGVLHRDIKGSNLLLDNEGVLKIADFGLASSYDPDHRKPMTSRVVTLWYRPPELLLGAIYYGVGVDLWSAGCILAELLAGKPILPGRTEVEQMHRIFKLCGSPSEEYWKKSKLPHATIFEPKQPYKRRIAETFNSFQPSSISLIETLLAIDPAERGTATAALNSEFFSTDPHACEPCSLPHYPPSKEMDAKLRDEEARRQKGIGGKGNGEALKKPRLRDHGSRAVPAPGANAELQLNLDRRRLLARVNATSKSEKFPPPHQDGAVGVPLDNSIHIGPSSFTAADSSFADSSFASSIFEPSKVPESALPGHLGRDSPSSRAISSNKKTTTTQKVAPSKTSSNRGLKPFPVGLLMELKRTRIHRRVKGRELEVFNGGKCT